MGKYSNIKEYMGSEYYNQLHAAIKPLVIKDKDDFDDKGGKIVFVELDDISVSGVTFDVGDNDEIIIRVSVDACVNVRIRDRGDEDIDPQNRTYNVFCSAVLKDGLQNFKIISSTEYNERQYDKDKSLSQDLVPYMYEDDVEKHAEDFLKRHYPKALLQPMPLPVEEIAESMGMKIYYRDLGDNVFGKTYFGSEEVEVQKSFVDKELTTITTQPGTMLINPDMYFCYNVGTMNNTIIHECVHWDRHQRPFELQKLLMGESKSISCEIVKTYDGMPKNASALKWMEWQANQLAPRILLPAKTTKAKMKELINKYSKECPNCRKAEQLEKAVYDLAAFFQVSVIAAKIRLIELGYIGIEGVYIYQDGKLLPPFSFTDGSLGENQTFVIDEQNAMREIFMNEDLRQMYFDSEIIYANAMVCLNSPKYITESENGKPILTDYALNHVDECCIAFDRKVDVGTKSKDTFYRVCFLCRDVNSETYIEAKYDPDHQNPQNEKARKEELAKIKKALDEAYNRFNKELPGGFAETLNYYMDLKDITNEELASRCNLSPQTISTYRNELNPSVKFENAVALCNGLKLNKLYAFDFMKKAGHDLGVIAPRNMVAKYIIEEHPDDTLQQWQDKFVEFGTDVKLPKCK